MNVVTKIKEFIKNKRSKKKKPQYTKIAVTYLLALATVWITWNYILATYALISYQTAEPMVELSKQVCTVILGTLIGYFVKSFSETFAEDTVSPFLQHKNEDKKEEEILG